MAENFKHRAQITSTKTNKQRCKGVKLTQCGTLLCVSAGPISQEEKPCSSAIVLRVQFCHSRHVMRKCGIFLHHIYLDCMQEWNNLLRLVIVTEMASDTVWFAEGLSNVVALVVSNGRSRGRMEAKVIMSGGHSTHAHTHKRAPSSRLKMWRR